MGEGSKARPERPDYRVVTFTTSPFFGYGHVVDQVWIGTARISGALACPCLLCRAQCFSCSLRLWVRLLPRLGFARDRHCTFSITAATRAQAACSGSPVDDAGVGISPPRHENAVSFWRCGTGRDADGRNGDAGSASWRALVHFWRALPVRLRPLNPIQF